jgi:hypothetical protein
MDLHYPTFPGHHPAYGRFLNHQGGRSKPMITDDRSVGQFLKPQIMRQH